MVTNGVRSGLRNQYSIKYIASYQLYWKTTVLHSTRQLIRHGNTSSTHFYLEVCMHFQNQLQTLWYELFKRKTSYFHYVFNLCLFIVKIFLCLCFKDSRNFGFCCRCHLLYRKSPTRSRVAYV